MYLSVLSIAPPIFFGILLFRRLPLSLKILTGYILGLGLLELGAYFLYMYKINNMLLVQLQTYWEFAAISVIFMLIFKRTKWKFVFGAIIPCYVIYGLFAFDSIGISQSVNFMPSVISALMIIGYVGAYYLYTIKHDDVPYLELSPYFILTSGWLLYFSGTILLFIFFDELASSQSTSVWVIHSLLNLLLNIFYTIVIWKGSRVPKLL